MAMTPIRDVPNHKQDKCEPTRAGAGLHRPMPTQQELYQQFQRKCMINGRECRSLLIMWGIHLVGINRLGSCCSRNYGG